MINRPDYISGIASFLDKPLVKILSGVGRCGKSTIFEMLHNELIAAMGDRPRCYPLLDEIQAMDGWKKAVNNLLESGRADIGYNRKMLDGTTRRERTVRSGIRWRSEITIGSMSSR